MTCYLCTKTTTDFIVSSCLQIFFVSSNLSAIRDPFSLTNEQASFEYFKARVSMELETGFSTTIDQDEQMLEEWEDEVCSWYNHCMWVLASSCESVDNLGCSI